MFALQLVVGGLAFLAGLGCSVFIVIEAFRDEIWKGILSICCGLYFLYYGLFEWEHEWKWPIFLGAVFADAIAVGIFRL